MLIRHRKREYEVAEVVCIIPFGLIRTRILTITGSTFAPNYPCLTCLCSLAAPTLSPHPLCFLDSPA